MKPGPAHAPSTRLPVNLLPLRSVVGKGGSLVVPLSDNMGNPCVEGGAPVRVSLNAKEDVLQARCEDLGDGSVKVSWSGKRSGSFMLDLKVGNVHVCGSPTQLTMVPSELDILQCELTAGRDAVAGVAERLEIRCRDAFGNAVEPLPGRTFGVILLALPSNDKSSKAEKAEKAKAAAAAGEGEGEKKSTAKLNKEERANLVKTMDSMPFEVSWDNANASLDYVPTEAGDFELHVWCDPDGSGTRLFLPGCPSFLHVSAGRTSATGSFLRENVAHTNLTAGDRLVLKMQMRDEYLNHAPLIAAEQEISATLETPADGLLRLTLKPDVVKPMAEHPGRDSKKSHVAQATALVGAYEINSPVELVVKGSHLASILLHGSPVTGSPVEIMVKPAAPIAARSRLQVKDGVQPTVDIPCEIVLQLVDKFGNEAETGGVRVDAKCFGSKASEANVVDCEDGTYLITFTAGTAGDYKVQVRLENIEMQVLQLHFLESEQQATTQEVPQLVASEESLPEIVELEEEAPVPAPAAAQTKKKKAKKSARGTGEASSRSPAPVTNRPAIKASGDAKGKTGKGGASPSKKKPKAGSAKKVTIVGRTHDPSSA